MQKNILVLDANQRSALAVVRSLGTLGLNVFTADNTVKSLAGTSRFVTNNYFITSPTQSTEDFILELVHLIDSIKIDILFPLTDSSIQAILHNRDRLPDVKLPFPDLQQYESVSNKAVLFQFAETIGVSVPKTYYINDIGTIPDILKAVNYNLVIKPYKSKYYVDGVIVPTEVLLPTDNAQIPALVQQHQWLTKFPFMLQQHVSGYGKGLFAIYNHGTPVAYFSHKRLKEKPPEGGVSVLSTSEPASAELIAIADKLLRAKNWHGVAMVEFKIDQNGVPYLMEINARFWGSLQLAIDSGIDFPKLLYKVAVGEATQPENLTFKKTTLRWILGDLDRLYIILKSSNSQYNLRQKIVEILKFMIPYSPGMRYETLRLNDTKPFLFELKTYFKSLLQSDKD